MSFDASIRAKVGSINNQVSFSEEYFDSLNLLRIELEVDINAPVLNNMHAKAFKLHQKAIAIVEERIVLFFENNGLYNEILPLAKTSLSSLNSLNDSLTNTDLEDLDELKQKMNDYCIKIKDFTFDFFNKVLENDRVVFPYEA